MLHTHPMLTGQNQWVFTETYKKFVWARYNLGGIRLISIFAEIVF